MNQNLEPKQQDVLKNLDPSIDKYPENLVHKILKQVSSMCQWGVKKSYQYYIFASLFYEFFDSVDEVFVKIASVSEFCNFRKRVEKQNPK